MNIETISPDGLKKTVFDVEFTFASGTPEKPKWVPALLIRYVERWERVSKKRVFKCIVRCDIFPTDAEKQQAFELFKQQLILI